MFLVSLFSWQIPLVVELCHENSGCLLMEARGTLGDFTDFVFEVFHFEFFGFMLS